MAKGLGDAIKRLSQATIASNSPADLRYGTVVSATPLSVRISADFILPEALLIVPERLTNREITVVDMGDGETEALRKTLFVYGALDVGDKVALIREQGGRKYYILDRIRGDG